MVSKKTFLLFFLFLILFQCVFAQYTEITDNDSIFGGYVTANRFYESDGTYVIPIYKVDWGLGFGDLEGIGLNATVRYSNLNYAIHSYWQNITNFPTDISFFNNDMGYLTNITVYTNLSQFINDVGFALTTDLTWNNISGKPTEISYWNNDVGYITMLNLTELQQQLLNESLTRNQTDDVLLSLINIVYNNVDALNTTKSGTGNCPLGYAVQNLTMGSPQCTPIMVTETDPIFMLNNATIWNGIDTIFNITNYLYTDIDNLNFSLQQQINNKLEITDQRYNDTAWVIQYFASLDIHNGTDGLNGTNGINGIDGINGTNGINGIDGLNGTNGLNGLNGMDGVNGTSLTMLSITNNFDGTFTWYFSDGTNFTTSNLTGQQGTQGIQGIAGINGIDGLNGTNGLDGLNGTNGLNGIDGVNGSQGIQGIQGIAGVNGTNGINGVNGTNGINGLNATDIGLFEKGNGNFSIVANPIKGQGQIRLVTGSGIVTGINTTFLGGGLERLDTYYAFYINGVRYFVFPISSNTTAQLTATLFGANTTWAGANTTTDLILAINYANGTEAKAFGLQSSANGVSATAFGYQTQANGNYATAFGDNTIANVSGGTAFGSNTLVSGIGGSTAFGLYTTASGTTSTAFGQNTISSGTWGTAMGYNTKAKGQASTSTGTDTNASGSSSFSTGFRTNADSYASFVIGRYNVGGGNVASWVDTDPLFEIGIGNSTNPKDAVYVDKLGRVGINTTTPRGTLDIDNGTLCLGSSCVSSLPTTNYGEIFNTTAGITLVMTTQNVYYNISGMGTTGLLGNFYITSDNGLVANRTGIYEITFVFSGSVNNNDLLNFRFIINSNADATSWQGVRFSSGLANAVTLHSLQTLNQGDVIRVQVRDTTRNGTTLTMDNRVLYAK